MDPAFPVAPPISAPVPDVPEDTADTTANELAVFGSSEYAKVVLGDLWGTPPALDLDAEADLHTLLAALAARKLLRSARDISDGGIAVALAQSCFSRGIGATIEQDPSLLIHPLWGIFSEPSSTVFVTTDPSNVSAVEKLADEFSFFAARIGSTGGQRLEISVYGDPFISAPLASLRKPWASALEATLHGEVTA
jgi:phosphoribosylformylglycinamidine synthase